MSWLLAERIEYSGFFQVILKFKRNLNYYENNNKIVISNLNALFGASSLNEIYLRFDKWVAPPQRTIILFFFTYLNKICKHAQIQETQKLSGTKYYSKIKFLPIRQNSFIWRKTDGTTHGFQTFSCVWSIKWKRRVEPNRPSNRLFCLREQKKN